MKVVRRLIKLALACLALFVVLRAHPAGVNAASLPQPLKLIALSFDDAPRARGAFLSHQERTDRLIASLRASGVEQAAFFVNPGQISGYGDAAGGADRIAAYVAAGHVIANHSNTHPRLSKTDAAAYIANIDTAEAWLAQQPGHRPWFRFPYLDEGGRDKAKRDILRMALTSRGLQNGYVTIDGSDWHMEQMAVDAVKAGKKIDMDALRDLYVETHLESAEFTDALAVRTLGRSPVHMLLLHETDLAALYIGDLVTALRKHGWEIVSADAAYADPIHTAAPDVPYAAGTLIEALAWEKGVPGPRWYERNNVEIASALFRRRVLHEDK